MRSSIGLCIGRACAMADASGPREGLAALYAIEALEKATHQPYWAALAHLLTQTGDVEAAKDAYRRAAGLAEDPAVRSFLLDQLARLV